MTNEFTHKTLNNVMSCNDVDSERGSDSDRKNYATINHTQVDMVIVDITDNSTMKHNQKDQKDQKGRNY